MGGGSKVGDAGRVGDGLLQAVGAEGSEADGGRAVDAAEGPEHGASFAGCCGWGEAD